MTEPAGDYAKPAQPALLHEYEWSIEELVHFRCTACGGWWAIGDAKLDRRYFCPFCGQDLAMAQYPEATPKPPTPPKALDL